MKVLAVSLISLSLFACDPSGDVLIKQSGTSETEVVWDMAKDNAGAFYMAASTKGNFDGQQNQGYSDALLIKYNAQGDKVWSRQWGDRGFEYVRGVATDSFNNVYAAGSFSSSTGVTDFFLNKFDSDGNLLWEQVLGSRDTDVPQGVAVDSKGDVYVVGATYSNLDGNTSAGANDVFIAKYTSAGQKVWVKQFGSSWHDYGSAIGIDSQDNIYVTGYGFKTMSDPQSEQAFIARYDTSGNQVWLEIFGTERTEYARDLVIDSQDFVYITGSTTGNLVGSSNNGWGDGFLAKYDALGNQVWVSQFGTGFTDEGKSLAVDDADNVYITGGTGGELYGNSHEGDVDIFLMKYTSAGERLWTKATGSNQEDMGMGVELDAEGNIIIGAYTSGSLPGNRNKGYRTADIAFIKVNAQ